MRDTGCIHCAGTGFMIGNRPCPYCNSKDDVDIVPIYDEVPVQYQRLKFDKELLPDGMQEIYGTFMESLMKEIVENASTFQRNTMICCRPNCGKTVWAYNLYSLLKSKQIDIPPVKDILEVKEIMSLADRQYDLCKEFSNDRFAIVKIPRQVNADMLESIQLIVERRVRNNGCTIFLYGGTKEDLKNQDHFGKLRYIAGNGSFNSVKIETFYDKKIKENAYD